MRDLLLNELKDAMKNKDELRKDTITMLRASILQIEKDEQKTLNEDEIKIVVSKEVKKRREAIQEFENANRMDVVESLNKEIDVLTKYLPEQLDEQQIRNLVQESIKLTGATSARDMGKVMQDLKDKTNGKADGKLVSSIVKELLM